MLTNTEMPELMENPGFFVDYRIRMVGLVEEPEFFARCFLCSEVEGSEGYFLVKQPPFARPFRALVFGQPELVAAAPTPTPTPEGEEEEEGVVSEGFVEAIVTIVEAALVEEFVVPDRDLLVLVHGTIRGTFLEEDRFGVRTLLPVIEWERLQVFFTNATWPKVLGDAQNFFLDLPTEEVISGLPISEEVISAIEALEVETYPFRFRTRTHPPPVVLQARVVTVTPRQGTHILLEVNSQNFGVSNPDTIISLPFPDAEVSTGDLIPIWGSMWPYNHPLDPDLSLSPYVNGPMVVAEGYLILGTTPQAVPSVLEVLDLLPETPPRPPDTTEEESAETGQDS